MREEFLEEAFLLQYHLNMNYSDVRSMPLPYRRWFIKRLADEFKKQSDARKKASDERQGLVDIPMGDMSLSQDSNQQGERVSSQVYAPRTTKFSND